MQLMLHESDRGAVLVGIAVIDESLTDLLQAAFVNDPPVQQVSITSLFSPNGPLATIWSKIHLANALGLLHPDVYSNLEIIRKLRNRFAYQKDPVDFLDTNVEQLINKLSITKSFHDDLMKGKTYQWLHEGGKRISEARMSEAGYVKKNKAAFVFSVWHALGQIETTTTTVSKFGIERGRRWAKNHNKMVEIALKIKTPASGKS